VLRAKTAVTIKKVRSNNMGIFFMNLFYTKSNKKKSPPTMLGETLNLTFIPT
jgi:hypothetical protein